MVNSPRVIIHSYIPDVEEKEKNKKQMKSKIKVTKMIHPMWKSHQEALKIPKYKEIMMIEKHYPKGVILSAFVWAFALTVCVASMTSNDVQKAREYVLSMYRVEDEKYEEKR